jgi:hypothetical protein
VNTLNRLRMPTILKVFSANGEGLTSLASPPRFFDCPKAFTIAPMPDESITGMASRSRITCPLTSAA